MKQSLSISAQSIRETLSSVHNINNGNVVREDDALNALELILYTLKLDSDLKVASVKDLGNTHFTWFKVTIENINEKNDGFLLALQKFIDHITLEIPTLTDKITYTNAVNIVESYFMLNYKEKKWNKYVGVTDLDLEQIKLKFNSPSRFTFLQNLGSDKSKGAFSILLTKGYRDSGCNEGKSLFAFERDYSDEHYR